MSVDAIQFPEFEGRDLLTSGIDSAVQRGTPEQVVAALRHTLTGLIDDPRVQLPPCITQPHHDHYARRELYRSPEHGYSVVAMTWAPGQGTPLHDHDGLWCVDGVWRGELQVAQYALLEHDGERARFRFENRLSAARGSAGSLIPPHEYHTLHNTSRDELAISVHVYQATMDRCTIFVPDHDDWYLPCEKQLAVDQDCS